MIFLKRSLLILSFSMLLRTNGVYGDWNWTGESAGCLKPEYDTYVSQMEAIFAPNGVLGDKSYVTKMQNMELRSIIEMTNFNKKIGEILVKINSHLYADLVRANVENSQKARDVITNLCARVKASCPEVSNPVPRSSTLHHAFVEILRGAEEDYVQNCGDYNKKTSSTGLTWFFKEEKKPNSDKGEGSSKGNFFTRKFSNKK